MCTLFFGVIWPLSDIRIWNSDFISTNASLQILGTMNSRGFEVLVPLQELILMIRAFY